MSAACPNSIVRYWLLILFVLLPSATLLGVCMTLGARDLVAVVGLLAQPAPSTTPITVQLGQTVLECSLYEDPANHLRSLSC